MRVGLFDSIPTIAGDGVILRPLDRRDIKGIEDLVSNDNVYRFLPTFLYERQYKDLEEMIDNIYKDLFTNRESLILAITEGDDFKGLAEFYGLNDAIHKISIGYRLIESAWGQGIASRSVASMVDHLYTKTDIEIITASTMVQNHASARVLMKNDFDLVVSGVGEDWGFPEPTPADKWVR